MRPSRAGLFFLLLLALSTAAPTASGQASGFVESMGFDRAYRPDAWVPMVVNLKSTLDEPAEYLIQVVQPDMDGDTVLFSRLVTLNANSQDKYWVYFRPRPSGLEANSVAELQHLLQVRLLTREGKQLSLLPLSTTLNDFDPRSFTARRGHKMVLAVVGGASTPSTMEFDPQNLLGVNEDVDFVKVAAADLPENALGYGMADAIVWFDADAADLSRGGSRKLQALQEWVRQGGSLVVCQPDEAYRIRPFADMLPVEVVGPGDKPLVEMVERNLPEPLHTLATAHNRELLPSQRAEGPDNWYKLTPPFRVGRATARDNALVEEWINWDPGEGGGRSPYIARAAFGLGSVTWIAQDLGGPSVTNAKFARGWPHVWDRVFGWKNRTVVVKFDALDASKKRADVWGTAEEDWKPGTMADLGGTLLSGMDHAGKASTYVFLVILFFIGYWIVAGPGSYLFLAGKGQRQLSWPIFAVSALAATLLTVLVVKLLLRGDPEVRHVTVVRLAPGAPAVAEARVGLYIPRDGPQTVALRDTDPGAVSTVTALAIHPQHLGSYTGFPDTADYRVDVRDVGGPGGVEVAIPYRSTLKKLQAHWVGNLPNGAGIVGDPELVEAGSAGDVNGDGKRDGFIGGLVKNQTGSDLKNVFLAFNYESPGVPSRDHLMYVPVWKAGETLDLLKTYAGAEFLIGDERYDKVLKGTAGVTVGFLDEQWGPNFHRTMRTLANTDGIVDDSGKAVSTSVVVMSLFDRIPPMANDRALGFARTELLRRGGRELDLSQLLAAGNLVIVGEADDAPLPFPMDVDGERMKGQGRVYYQATLPLRNRTKLAQPAPEETPATAPAAPQPAGGPEGVGPEAAAPGA